MVAQLCAHVSASPRHMQAALTARCACRNELEAFLFSMRAKVENELKGKLGGDEAAVQNALQEGLNWLEETPEADTDSYKDKLNAIYDLVKPVLAQHRGRQAAATRTVVTAMSTTSCESSSLWLRAHLRP
jgi:hypothetical protein